MIDFVVLDYLLVEIDHHSYLALRFVVNHLVVEMILDFAQNYYFVIDFVVLDYLPVVNYYHSYFVLHFVVNHLIVEMILDFAQNY